MAQFTIKRASNSVHYYWTLAANNGEIVAVSETYNSKAAAMHGINSVKAIAGTAWVNDLA
ncbi:YegP family protein [Microbacterium oryzae]|uniref:YegP family protein n=1 Tax=Microbacterium oryzae TaxID=743009 RepID=UPI0025B14EA3|nr:YegP family protein [Microbacterium oryzae]MDN3310531.1 YegP family protein [Microbacterium oryzae]